MVFNAVPVPSNALIVFKYATEQPIRSIYQKHQFLTLLLFYVALNTKVLVFERGWMIRLESVKSSSWRSW